MGEQLRFGSLFAGIGGFDLGLERAGMQCAWQVENDDYANQVLAKHWPDVRRWDDVRTFPPYPIKEWRVDLLCGGFPCQDISSAGHRAGIDGKKSGLWFEFARVVRILRPYFVIVENVADLTVRGLGEVLKSLATIGFDAEWQVLPAAAFGQPHIRNRIFIVAYANRDDGHTKCNSYKQEIFAIPQWDYSSGLGEAKNRAREASSVLRRVADGLSKESHRNQRCKCLGNAVVPQVAEWIGRRIVEFDSQ